MAKKEIITFFTTQDRYDELCRQLDIMPDGAEVIRVRALGAAYEKFMAKHGRVDNIEVGPAKKAGDVGSIALEGAGIAEEGDNEISAAKILARYDPRRHGSMTPDELIARFGPK